MSTSAATRALEIFDIIISLVNHIDSQNDKARFSSINRRCYEACLIPRAHVVRLDQSRVCLWSFFIYIRRRKVAGHCNSLTIIKHEFERVAEPPLEGYLCACLVSLILKELGDSSEKRLKYIRVGPKRFINAVYKRKDIEDFHAIAQAARDDELDHWQILDGSTFSGLLNQAVSEEGIESAETDSSVIWKELFRSTPTALEEADIWIDPSFLDDFCCQNLSSLTTLHLDVYLTSAINSNNSQFFLPLPKLETLKLRFLYNTDLTTLSQWTFPNLRAFELDSIFPGPPADDETNLAIAHFIKRHPLLQAASLGEDYVRGAGRIFQSSENLRALHLRLPTSSGVLIVPTTLGAIPRIKYLRLTGAVSSVLMFLKNSPARSKLPHFRCVELECGNAKDFRDLMRPIQTNGRDIIAKSIRLWDLFPNLCEIAFSVSSGSVHVQEILPLMLERLQDCNKLVALRWRNSNLPEKRDAFPIILLENAKVIPPKLKYVVWENGESAQIFELGTDVGDGTKRIVTEIPPLRATPSKGRWTVDWHEESVFDHITEEPV